MHKVRRANLVVKTKLVFALTASFAFATANAALTAVANSPSSGQSKIVPALARFGSQHPMVAMVQSHLAHQVLKLI